MDYEAYVLKFAPEAKCEEYREKAFGGSSILRRYVIESRTGHLDGRGESVYMVGWEREEWQAWEMAATKWFMTWASYYLRKLVVEGKTLSEEEIKFLKALLGSEESIRKEV